MVQDFFVLVYFRNDFTDAYSVKNMKWMFVKYTFGIMKNSDYNYWSLKHSFSHYTQCR